MGKLRPDLMVTAGHQIDFKAKVTVGTADEPVLQLGPFGIFDRRIKNEALVLFSVFFEITG